MELISEKVIPEKKSIEINVSQVMSILTVLFLSCVVVIFSALVCDMFIKINNQEAYTIVYEEVVPEEEATALRVNF